MDCVLREGVEQWPHPVVHHFAHHQGRGGAFDALDVQDVPGDAIQIVGVPGRDVDEQVGDTAEAVHFEDLGYRVECGSDAVEFALGDVGEHVRLQRIPEDGRVDAAFERAQRPRLVELAQACLNSVAGQTCSIGHRQDGGTWVVGQGGQDSRVDPVGSVCAWHSAHLPLVHTRRRGA